MKQFDLIALGDITTDAFIQLALNSAHIEHGEKGKEQLCMNFGDKIPYERVDIIRAVGNSPNAAVSAARLGLHAALVTNIGDDQNGAECKESLEKSAVDTSFISTHTGKETNYHYVLRYEEERTILIRHIAYDYRLPDIGEPTWLYLSSLGENSLPHHEEIVNYLKEHPQVKLAFQPGTFQMKLGYEKLKGMYEHAELFFCNKEESQRILGSMRKTSVYFSKTCTSWGPR